MALNATVAKLAVSKLAEVRNMYAEHDEYKRECYKEGFRPQYCVHGTNQWTDYDNICGGCEDGRGYFDYETEALDAIAYAKAQHAKMEVRLNAVVALAALGAPVSAELSAWVAEPITKG